MNLNSKYKQAASIIASALCITALICFPLSADEKKDTTGLPPISEFVAEIEKTSGFFNYYWDNTSGKLYLEISSFDAEFLYVSSIRTGIGSNDIGLDRGQLSAERVVHFERIGPKVLLIENNLAYRALTDNPDERRAVEESFAKSVLWGVEISAETNGVVLVECADFLIRDAHGVVSRLDRAEQGTFSLDKARSVVDSRRCKAFPKNTELEALLTFQSSKPGPQVRATTPDPKSVTLWIRHSLIKLPDPGYQTRDFDPRAGAFALSFADYATALDQPLTKRLIVRHRLQKQNPASKVSDPIEPIIYYVDRGAPESVRQALIDGASWWAEAFKAAGFSNAFEVKVMPEGADPLDVRYNVIQWVHRSTRGWSYGGSVIDPRSGEIIKGHVSLGSLRVRQDRLLFEGLHPLFMDGQFGAQCEIESAPSIEAIASVAPDVDPVELALGRIRQLSAHEVGHTLGMAHNFAASTYGRASVMDYPAPLVNVTDSGELDFSSAYSVGIGEWDKTAIRYAYTEFLAGEDESAELNALIESSIAGNQLFITDQDSRSGGSAHPLANLWDNGADPVEALEHEMRVREIALEKFGKQSIETGEPLSELEKILVPLYLRQRYQILATAKTIGGVFYSYQLRGDAQSPPEPVDPQTQRRALSALMATITPEALALPENVRSAIPPPAFGFSESRESFPGHANVVFDPLAIAEIAAQMTVKAVLNPERAARLLLQKQYDNAQLSLREVFNRLIEETWGATSTRDQEIAAYERVAERVVVDELMNLAGNSGASADVRAVAGSALKDLRKIISRATRQGSELQRAHAELAREDLDRFLNRPHTSATAPEKLKAPPGSPIGER